MHKELELLSLARQAVLAAYNAQGFTETVKAHQACEKVVEAIDDFALTLRPLKDETATHYPCWVPCEAVPDGTHFNELCKYGQTVPGLNDKHCANCAIKRQYARQRQSI